MGNQAALVARVGAPVVPIVLGVVVYDYFGVEWAVTFGLLVALGVMIAIASTVAPARFF